MFSFMKQYESKNAVLKSNKMGYFEYFVKKKYILIKFEQVKYNANKMMQSYSPMSVFTIPRVHSSQLTQSRQHSSSKGPLCYFANLCCFFVNNFSIKILQNPFNGYDCSISILKDAMQPHHPGFQNR